ncbi:MAG: hypothetical protein HY694_09875 [Deltaproteobacteria bacterium]|nr:hypothetical protein [Deltaproteobacteria bacterium]
MDNARAPRKAVQSILGHDNAKTTDIYLQTLDDVAIRTAELLVGIKKPVDSGGGLWEGLC